MQTQPFVPHAGFVSDVKKTFSHEYLQAQRALGVNVRHYKEWDKSDLVALYGSYFGRVVFDHLAGLVIEAHREEMLLIADPSCRLPTFAQNDLNELAPHGLNWKGYAAIIAAAVAEVRAAGFAFRADHLPTQDELFAVAPPFNQQSALAWMEDSQMQAMESGDDDAFAAA